MKNKVKNFFLFVGFVLLVYMAYLGLRNTVRGYAESMPTDIVFDHSQCQYPKRSSNPANGCDNSDPCDPEDAAKGGSGSCKDYGAGTDPNRDYFDADGNQYDYKGDLVQPAPVMDPSGGK